MSEVTGQTELQKQSQALFDGPLKHVRGAALAAALVPLASVLATPASAQQAGCASAGTVCGFVFNDTNGNGIQDAGETGIAGVLVTIVSATDGSMTTTLTDGNGVYAFLVPPDTYQTFVQIPVGTSPSPANVGTNDTIDSDGVSNGLGSSVATTTTTATNPVNIDTDFGFVPSAVQSPGTGTPGYWKNHPEAWPVASITIGGVTYTRDQAIAWLKQLSKDKTTTMFSSLVSAKLNVLIGNDSSCVGSTIAAADLWMATYGPVGSGVLASSQAWAIGEPLHQQMDAYNNGLLCAPHRQ
jgi:SdrD B-like domain